MLLVKNGYLTAVPTVLKRIEFFNTCKVEGYGYGSANRG